MSSATKAPGAEGPGDWAALSPQEIVQRTRCQADCDFAPYSAAVWRECCDLILNRLGPVSIASAPTPLDRVGEEVAERIVQRLLNAKHDLRDVAGRFEAIDIVREEVGRQTFAPWVRSLDDARFTENEVAPIKERLERAFYDAGGFHGQIVEYAARTALPVVLELLASAPAPSDPAEAGGDLGKLHRGFLQLSEDALTFAKETDSDKSRDHYLAAWATWKEAARMLGQLVASTPGQKGAGEEKTGASFGPGSREPGPSVPAFGFDPSRAALRALRIGDMVRVKQNLDQPWTFDWQDGPYEVIGLALDRHGDPIVTLSHDGDVGSDGFDPSDLVLAASCDGSAEGGETEGLDPKGNSAVGEAETPAQTPPSPPSATPEGDPPMTVEEARAFLVLVDQAQGVDPGFYATLLRNRAVSPEAYPHVAKEMLAQASRIELALRTLHAAGEVR